MFSFLNSSDRPDFFCTTVDNTELANLVVIGVPWDASSSYRKGCSKAPEKIRQATSGELYNYFTEKNVNLKDKWQIFDAGDVEITTDDASTTRKEVFNSLKQVYNVRKPPRFLFLGGDHLTTYFCFHSCSELGIFENDKTGILYLDAHPDLYYHYKGNIYSHACVLRRILDQTKINPSNIIQIGIRASTEEQRAFAKNADIKTISTNELQREGTAATARIIKEKFSQVVDQIYLSVDLDVLEPGYAPGLGNPEPAGLTTRDVVNLIQELAGLSILAFDIVEYCPDYDQSDITAFAAAKLIKEILGIMS